jgi:ABC-type sugar transport system ATPase subunit
VTSPALALAGVRKAFGPTLALDDASLSVRPDTVHALLGANGAGKTTLMRIAFGMTRTDAGPPLLIAENPTRGRYVDAADGVLARLRSACAADMAAVVYSSDLDEVLSVAQRVLVVHDGRVVDVIPDHATVGA